jgi:hypothetical protein
MALLGGGKFFPWGGGQLPQILILKLALISKIILAAKIFAKEYSLRESHDMRMRQKSGISLILGFHKKNQSAIIRLIPKCCNGPFPN